MITYTRLLEALYYDAITGEFTWKIDSRRNASRGQPAGILNGRNKQIKTICIDGTAYMAARLAWLYVTGNWPIDLIGYINFDTTDTRFINLYEINRKEQRFKVISHKRLLQLLHYNPLTGDITWRVAMRGHKIGDNAKSLMKIGYYRVRIESRTYLAHRLAWFYVTGKWPKEEVDHIDGDRANIVFANLREATKSQNMSNRPFQTNNTSGFKGVWKHRNRWVAEIKVNGVKHRLGSFTTIEEAAHTYNLAAKELHGDFANTGNN